MQSFIAGLIAKQGTMSGRKFAQSLGISPAEWSRMRLGRREPSKRIQQIAIARWPDLVFALMEDAKAGQKESAA